MRRYVVAGALVLVVAAAGCSDPRGTPSRAPAPGAATSAAASPSTAQSAAKPEPKPIVIALVEVPQDICLPPNVPGNCWLPFYPTPRIEEGKAINQTKVCNNQSLDQSSCWPQPNTTVEVVCYTSGPDGSEWYGVRVPQEHIKATLPEGARPVPGSTDILGHAAAVFLGGHKIS